MLALPAAAHSRLAAGRRRSADLASRGSSAASERTLTVDTASSPPQRPLSSRGAATAPVADVAAQLEGIALDAQSAGSGAAAAATSAAAAAAAVAAARAGAVAAGPAPQHGVAGPPAQQAGGPANGGSAAAAAATPGAAMFSVPSASAPTTGIYSIPQEMFKIKDLDAGREYSLDQVAAARCTRPACRAAPGASVSATSKPGRPLAGVAHATCTGGELVCFASCAGSWRGPSAV
jgi:type II secretory pathway component HofQ